MEKSGDTPENIDASNSEEHPNGPIAKKKRRRTAWNHFSIVPGSINDKEVDFAQCNYCVKKYQYSGKGVNGSTGNLINHLKNKHPEIQINAEASSLQTTTEIVFSQGKYRNALLKWMIERGQSVYEPQTPSFLEIVRSLNPFAETVSPAMLLQDMTELYTNKVQSVKQRISEVPGKLSFTIMKKSVNCQSFLHIKAHWIQNWKAESELLDFGQIEGNNSTSIMCDLFVRCLKRYDIPFSKILGVTLDNVSENEELIDSLCKQGMANGSNISSATNILESLQNIAMSSVETLLNQAEESDTHRIESVTKLRKLIMTIKESSDLQQEFQGMCVLMGVESSLLIVDEKPNSAIKMIEGAVHLQQALRAICIKLSVPSELMIAEDEWKELNALMKLLQKFYRAVDFVPISSYLATINWWVDSLNAIINECRGCLADASKICLTQVNAYKKEISESKIPFITTLLNPALKLTYLQEHNYSKSNVKNIEKEVHEVFKVDYEAKASNSTDKSDDDDDELLSHMYKRSTTVKLSKEFQKYLRYPLTSPKSDVVEFWKLNETEFPCLSKMARDYLGISSSIQVVENKMGHEIKALSSEQIQAAYCLEYWLKSKN